MITDKEFIKQENEEEIFSVIESFLNRAKEKGLFKAYEQNTINGVIVWTDKEKSEIIKSMIKDFKSYKK